MVLMLDVNDEINKNQINTLKNKFDSHQFYKKLFIHEYIFISNFYDLKEPILYQKSFNYSLPVFLVLNQVNYQLNLQDRVILSINGIRSYFRVFNSTVQLE